MQGRAKNFFQVREPDTLELPTCPDLETHELETPDDLELQPTLAELLDDPNLTTEERIRIGIGYPLKNRNLETRARIFVLRARIIREIINSTTNPENTPYFSSPKAKIMKEYNSGGENANFNNRPEYGIEDTRKTVSTGANQALFLTALS